MSALDYTVLSAREYLYLVQVKQLIEESDKAINSLVVLLLSPPPWDENQQSVARRLTSLLSAAADVIRTEYSAPSAQFSAYHRKMVQLLDSFSEFGERVTAGIATQSVGELERAKSVAVEFGEIAASSAALLSELIGTPREAEAA